jgi:hypothetical protein
MSSFLYRGGRANTIRYAPAVPAGMVPKKAPVTPKAPVVEETVRYTSFKPILAPYSTPTRDDCAVVIPFFNPTGSFRMIQNVLLCTQRMKTANIPVFVVELANAEANFVFPASPTVFHYVSESIMFYKENLLVVAERLLPNTYTKILLLDSDILFQEPSWYDSLSIALDTHDVVQPFRHAHFLNSTFRTIECVHSLFAPPSPLAPFEHTGFGWAFRRDWYACAGVFEYALIGGGDTLLAMRLRHAGVCHRGYKEDFGSLAAIPSGTRVGFVNVTVYHLFHGPRERRQYASREEMLWRHMQTNRIAKLSTIVQRRDDGILEWIPLHRGAMNALMKSYFTGRSDDDV